VDEAHITEDIYRVLKEKEKTTPKFEGNSPQLCFRRYLVDWLALLGLYN